MVRKLLPTGIILASLFVSGMVCADTLQLKNGVVLEGTIIEETENSVTFGVEGGSVKFSRSEIASLEKRPLSKPLLKPKSAAPSPQTKEKWFKDLGQGDVLERIRSYVENASETNFITPAGFQPDRIVPTLIRLVVAFFFTALVIMIYARLLGKAALTYGFSLWFLFKYNLVTNLVIMAAALIAGMANANPIPIVIAFLFAIWFFFYFAKRELEFGFLKSLGLFALVVANMLPGVIMAAYGLI
ncbi:MAG: hypothetical protein HY447_00910 [Candidatus Omnitrophica bacterium]|nr:hypothetical protein [Candidatus Omnitrophota bacterium]